jgi:CBS domain containing-hemolysin-like protein
VGLLVIQIGITSAHYALDNVSRKWLKERGEGDSGRAKQTLRLLDRDDEVLLLQQLLSLFVAMVFAGILVEVVGVSMAEAIQQQGIEESLSKGLVFPLLLLPSALVIFFVGHQLPVAVVSGREDSAALVVTPLVSALLYLLHPLLSLIQRFSHSIGSRLGGDGNPGRLTEEEIKTLVSEGSEEGVIEDDEKTMIYSVFKLGDTLVRELMVPRTDIIAISTQASLQQALETIITAGHSRIPVYDGDIDTIKGILYAKDLLPFWLEQRQECHLTDVIRAPYYVPAYKKADELMDEFRRRKTHLAIVNDEYGSTTGLVTLEDLLELIVGDIQDEYDFYEESAYQSVNESDYLLQAWIDLDDLNELLDIALSTDDNDTLGGYIFSELGQIPKVGAKIISQGYEFEIVSLKDERRIQQVLAHKLSASEVELETMLPEKSDSL